MPALHYTGDATRRPADASPWPVPVTRREKLLDPRGYQPDAGLVHAVNVALLLEQPLLLTGEPGTGKTQLAYSLAYELGLQPPLTYETKSNSTATELFYRYDAVRHFRASRTAKKTKQAELPAKQAESRVSHDSALHYITWHALGEAILQSQPGEKVAHLLPPKFVHHGPCRSVVLIDEIDKAPRDFPNDLLNEVEQLFFRVPELESEKVDANPDLRPLLVLTSNSEKNLPEAFLRRCAYYHISFPADEELKKIVKERVGDFAASETPLLKDAFLLFRHLRNRERWPWEKIPATAELIGWLTVLREKGAQLDLPLREQPEVLKESLSALVKSPKDQARIVEIIKSGKW